MSEQDASGRLWRTTDELNRLAREHRDPLVRDLAEEVVFTRGRMYEAGSRARTLTADLERCQKSHEELRQYGLTATAGVVELLMVQAKVKRLEEVAKAARALLLVGYEFDWDYPITEYVEGLHGALDRAGEEWELPK